MAIGLMILISLNKSFEVTSRTDSKIRALEEDKIRTAVWGCGVDKSPGPDGFTFDFFRFRVDHSITLSHLFYADDAVFIGEWSHSSLKGIMNILRCFSLLSVLYAAFNSTWSSIINEVNSLKDKGVDLISHCVESHQHDHLSVLLDSVILSNMDDRWFWDLNGDSVFRVKDVRILLDEAFLPKMKLLASGSNKVSVQKKDRTNHLNVTGQWKLFAEKCNFEYSKLTRFKFMYMEDDEEAEDDEPQEYPVFHPC
nr:hypothetical protein [Tanacetum cinerariifolium]